MQHVAGLLKSLESLQSIGGLFSQVPPQSQKGSGKKGKGNGKGASTASKGNGKGQLCKREVCRAARNKQSTWGGGPNCHCCGSPFSQQPPMEEMAEWAFNAALLEAAGQKGPKAAPAAKAAAQAKAKAKAKAAAKTNAGPSTAELAELRKSRLEQLKAAKEAVVEPPTIAEEMVEKVFGSKKAPTTASVHPETEAASRALQENARQVVVSLKAEVLPGVVELSTPEESFEILLERSSEYRSGEGIETAATALKTTRTVILTMQDGGTHPEDELLLKLIAREKSQASAHAKLLDKAPSCGMRRETLLSIKQDFVRQMTKETDGRKIGAAKAADRATERQRVARLNLAAAQALVDECAETSALLSNGHRERGDRKHAHCLQIVELLDQRLAKMSADDVVFVDAMEDVAPQTAAETERDEAIRCADLLTLQLQQFQAQAAAYVAATTAAEAAPEPAAPAQAPAGPEVDPCADLWLDFHAEKEQLPVLGTPDALQLRAMQQLAAIFAAVPWGTQTPALRFDSIDTAPSFVHSLVGDTIWLACWKDRKDNIHGSHWIPFKLLNILMTVVKQEDGSMEQQQLDMGKKRFAEVEDHALKHRRRIGQ